MKYLVIITFFVRLFSGPEFLPNTQTEPDNSNQELIQYKQPHGSNRIAEFIDDNMNRMSKTFWNPSHSASCQLLTFTIDFLDIANSDFFRPIPASWSENDNLMNIFYPGFAVLLFLIFFSIYFYIHKIRRKLAKSVQQFEFEKERSELQFKILTESCNDIIFMLDKNAHLTIANQCFYQYFNNSKENLRNKCLPELLPKEASQLFKDKIKKVQTGQTEIFQWHLISNSENQKTMETTLSPIPSEKNSIAGIIGVTRDLTEHFALQQALKSEKDKLESILEAMQDMVIILSDDLKILYVNRTFKQSFSNVEIGGSCVELLDLLDAYRKKRKYPDAIEPCVWEHWDDTQQIWMGVVACPIMLPEGLCQLFILRDISQTRKLEQERLNAERLAAVTHTAIAYNHEINNPLFGIIGYLEIMMQNETNSQRLEELQLIYDAANRIAEVTRRLRKLTTPAIREYVGSVKMLDLAASSASIATSTFTGFSSGSKASSAISQGVN